MHLHLLIFFFKAVTWKIQRGLQNRYKLSSYGSEITQSFQLGKDSFKSSKFPTKTQALFIQEVCEEPIKAQYSGSQINMKFEAIFSQQQHCKKLYKLTLNTNLLSCVCHVQRTFHFHRSETEGPAKCQTVCRT